MQGLKLESLGNPGIRDWRKLLRS